MDPVAIVGLVGTVISFVQFSHEVLSTAGEIWSSSTGMSDDVARLRSLVTDIQANTRDATRAISARGISGRESLAQISKDCEKVANKLLKRLGPLKTERKGLGRKVDAIRKSAAYYWRRDEISELKLELLSLETRLSSWWQEEKQGRHRSFLEETLQGIASGMENLQAVFPVDTFNSLIGDMDKRLDALTRHADHYQKLIIEQENRYKKILNQKSPAVTSEPDELSRSMDEAASGHINRLTTAHEGLGNLLDEVKKVRRQSDIIRSLLFDSIKRRHSQIEKAHSATLEWIFDPEQTNFINWLKGGDGVYWVNGQAGSGKSTLMKFVSGHEKTKIALEEWAGGQGIVCASHYFWNAGSEWQKSQLGLFQNLLYHVLRSVPRLIDTLCSTHDLNDVWDIDELKETLKRLGEETGLGVKFCFFVDGLDEYGGAEEDIVEVIRYLALSEHVKICTSSRPWPAFSSEWKLSKYTIKLQDHTKEDMDKYVRERLEENKRFRELASQDNRCYQIIQEISNRASGVWVWVYLVVRDVLRDIRDEEEFEQLMERLNSYPAELDDYFEDIMKRRDPTHRAVSSQIFLLVVTAVRPLPILTFATLEICNDLDKVIGLELTPVTNAEITKLEEKWRIRLQNRCRDLLKITSDESESLLFKYQVDFLHRTVRDFLSEHYLDQLHEKAPEGFDASVCLSRLMLVFIKRIEILDFIASLNSLIALVDELLLYSWVVEQYPLDKYQETGQEKLLDELDKTMSHRARSEARHWTNARDSPPEDDEEPWHEAGQASFLALATQARLRLYVKHKLAQDRSPVSTKTARPILDYALRPKRVTPIVLPYNVQYDIPWLDIKLIDELLQKGADPNRKIRIYKERTPWALFLMSCRKNWKSWPGSTRNLAYQCMVLLLQYGADPQVKIPMLDNQGPREQMARYRQPVEVERAGSHTVSLSQVTVQLFGSSARTTELLNTAKKSASKKGVFKKIVAWIH